MTLVKHLTLVLGFVACTPRSDLERAVESPPSGIVEVAAMDAVAHEPDGAWVLSGFHDSILVNRQIGRYRRPVPVWTALLLRVDSAVVKCNGILLPQTELHARWGKDTLLVIDKYDQQAFVYDAMEDRIQVFFKRDADAKEGAMDYRRLRPEEHQLLADIDSQHRGRPFTFEENYHKHLTRLLFAGRFEPLDRGQHAFTIDDNGHIAGHPIWNAFWFHDYFGTLHPFEGDVDGLVFTDTTEKWPDNTFSFNWRFVGDTLVLRSMTTDGDRYYLSKGELRFLKRSW